MAEKDTVIFPPETCIYNNSLLIIFMWLCFVSVTQT